MSNVFFPVRAKSPKTKAPPISGRAFTIPITLNPVTLNEVIANANPYGSNGSFSNGDLTSLKLSRDGMTYDIDFEYLSRTSLIQNYIYLKDKDVIYLPDNSLSQVHVLGEANSPSSITLRRKNISLSYALATSQGLNQSTSRGKEVYVFRPKDYEGKPRIFKSNISSPVGEEIFDLKILGFPS